MGRGPAAGQSAHGGDHGVVDPDPVSSGTLTIRQKFWSSREKASRKIAEQLERIERLDPDPGNGTLEIEPEKSYAKPLLQGEGEKGHDGEADRDG